MSNRWSGFVALSVLVLSPLASAIAAADPPVRTPEGLLDAEALAARIDHFLAVRQAGKGVLPAPLADDAEFIRRVYLDLAGCIPSILDICDFLDDTRPNKRRLWVDRLLIGNKPSRKPDAFRRHFANLWRAWILSRVNTEQEHTAGLATATETWLQARLKENAPFDRIVREVIAASFFNDANESKPQNLAASTSRLFLGIKLECAQCHDDRSGGSWTQGQFWSFAAFFSNRQIAIPGKKKTARARFLDGPEPTWKSGDDSRAVLADWLASADNPYFARAAVNRLWAYFFGTGLVEPVDEQGGHNPPSHPELLDELARQFAGHGFDLKYLIRALVASQAYQRTSAVGHPGLDNLHLFARMPVRGLSPEQLFDSLAEAAGFEYNSTAYAYRDPRINLSPRQQFLARFAHQDRPTEAATSIQQALYLMNGSFVAERTSPELNQTLSTLAGQKTSHARRVETLFLVVLSRKPTATEMKRIVAYLEHGGVRADPRRALADIFWALLNGPEFSVNH